MKPLDFKAITGKGAEADSKWQEYKSYKPRISYVKTILNLIISNDQTISSSG